MDDWKWKRTERLWLVRIIDYNKWIIFGENFDDILNRERFTHTSSRSYEAI